MRGQVRTVSAAALLAAISAWACLAARPASAQTPEPAGEHDDEVDWRGIERLDDDGRTTLRKDDRPPPSPVTTLVRNAPYRVEVVTTNGKKVLISNALTLERRRILLAEAILAYAFSPDGAWLYVAQRPRPDADAELVAVDPRTARVERLGGLQLAKGEVVVHLEPHGNAEVLHAIAVIGQGPAPAVSGPCGTWRKQRRVRLKRPAAGGKVRRLEHDGPPEGHMGHRHKTTSPNTKRRAVLEAGRVRVLGRFGGKGKTLADERAPGGAAHLSWMQDSEGLLVFARDRADGCRHRLAVSALREPEPQPDSRRRARWRRLDGPDGVQVMRGALPSEEPQVTPDGMRLVGVAADGKVVLLEPWPRFDPGAPSPTPGDAKDGRIPATAIAPATTLWPVVRPGVRPLGGPQGPLRHAALLIEQGQLDAGAAQLEALAKRHAGQPGVDKAAAQLRARLAKLRRVYARRVPELGLPPLEGAEPAPATAPADAPKTEPSRGRAPPRG